MTDECDDTEVSTEESTEVSTELSTESLIPPAWLAVLDAIATHFRAAIMRGVLVTAGHADELLDAMIAAQWLEAWGLDERGQKCLKPWLPKEGGDAVALTYSPWVAELLGVEIVEEGMLDRARWGKARYLLDDLDALSPPSPLPSWDKLPEPVDHYDAGSFVVFRGDIADPSPGPVEVAEAREAVAMRSEEVERYDEVKGERSVEVISVPVELWGNKVPVKGGMKGKGGKR